MNAAILAKASQVIPDNELLVNIVRLRVRQLNIGHRPLVLVPPGMGMADVALSEIADKKLTSAPNPDVVATPIIAFPSAAPKKKAA
jgi:hypothetical protein